MITTTALKADAHEREADRNLTMIAERGEVSPETVAMVAQAMATLAVSHRVADLTDLLANRLPPR